MSERAEFHVMGQPLDGTPLHYTASGLDYVYLMNGVTVEDDPKYGSMVTIQDEGDLHRAIGLYVIMQPRPLTGAEFRFLRKQMGMRQKDLANQLGVNEQTVANYEKSKPVPPTSDHFMRTIFLLWMMPPDERAEHIKRIAEEITKHATASRHRRKRSEPKPVAAMPPAEFQASIAKQWQAGGRAEASLQTCHHHAC